MWDLWWVMWCWGVFRFPLALLIDVERDVITVNAARSYSELTVGMKFAVPGTRHFFCGVSYAGHDALSGVAWYITVDSRNFGR
jgi:hypothetical protein